MLSERLGRSDRLLRSRDFQRVARQGTRSASREFVMLVAPARVPNEHFPSAVVRRIGITASRKVGNAVARNRIKRAVREWFRRSRGDFQGNVDVVVIARRSATELSGPQLLACLRRLSQEAVDGRRSSHG